MKRVKILLCITCLFATVVFLNCKSVRNYNFSLQNTLSIFFIDNDKNYYFSMPVQYIGDYQIDSFEFIDGYVLIGDYKILLERKDVNVDVYVNENSDEYGNTDGPFNLIYSEKKEKILLSKIDEPLKRNNESQDTLNFYCIIIDKKLKNNEMKKIISEFEKGNTYSHFYLWYKVSFDYEQEEAGKYGIYDDFELSNGIDLETGWFPPNLEFFKTKVLQKH